MTLKTILRLVCAGWTWTEACGIVAGIQQRTMLARRVAQVTK